MLVVENLGVSTFKVLPHSAKQGILYKQSWFQTVTELTPINNPYDLDNRVCPLQAEKKVQGEEAVGYLSDGQ
jgi:hypothetical protein